MFILYAKSTPYEKTSESPKDMNPVIPPRKNRKTQRTYDKELYKLRHLVENAFLYLKQWRGIATRYTKRCIALWANVS